MKPPSLIQYQDRHPRYSFFADIHNFQRLYRLRMKFHGPTLFLALEPLPANHDQLIDVAKRLLQLRPKLCDHEQFLELSRQEIYQCRYLLGPSGDDDLLKRLLPLLPFQSGQREEIHRLLLRQHQVHDAPLPTYRSLKSHQIHKLIYRC